MDQASKTLLVLDVGQSELVADPVLLEASAARVGILELEKSGVASSPVAVASTTTPTPTQDLTKVGPNFEAVRADGTKSFGHYYLLTATQDEPVDYSKDLMVQVDKVGPMKPGPYAAVNGTKAKRYTKYKITVINNHAKAEDLQATTVNATDGDAAAGQVFDDTVGSAPSVPVRSGKTVHWFTAFGDDQKDQTISIQIALKQDDGTYSGGAPLVWTK